jgi:hypothetical protein
VRGLAILPAILLTACASGVAVERQVVVAGDRFANVQGEAALLVRTFLAPEGQERREVVGARCTVSSSLYGAELVTPARLVVPNFGPQSPELGVSCRADDWTGSGVARIVTRWNEPPGYWGYPAYGLYAPFGFGFDWYGAPAYPVSSYPDLHVTLR